MVRQRPCRHGSSIRRAQGFTLIELMVVVVIIGIAAAMIGVNAFPDRKRALREDADRLAQLFTVAQGEVRADGRQITWQSDAEGYRFIRRARVGTPGSPTPTDVSMSRFDTFGSDELLRPRRWKDGPVQVQTSPAGPPVFTSEWIPAPMSVKLQNADATVLIVRDEGGRYAVK